MSNTGGQSCRNCSYFLLIDGQTGKGVCRVNPPKLIEDNKQSSKTDDLTKRWPLCWYDEWCGRWTKP